MQRCGLFLRNQGKSAHWFQAIRAPSQQRRGHGAPAAGTFLRFRASQCHEACTAVSRIDLSFS